jgi:chitin synthase
LQNILGIYAYSNLHDLSWGTKGLETAGHGAAKAAPGNGNLKEIVAQQKRVEAEKQRAAAEKEDVDNSFRAFRSSLLLFWLVTNAVWMYCMTYFVSSSCYLKFISYVVAVFNIIRFLGSAVFLSFRIARRLGTCGAQHPDTAGHNYQAHLPTEWQKHYKRDSNATTETTTGNGHVELNMSDLSSPVATDYKNMQ